MTFIRLAAGAAFAVALSGQAAAGPALAAGNPAHDHAGGHDADATASAALSLEPERPRAGERAALIVSLSDAAGEPLEELITSHGRKLHAVIVSEDMKVFGHIHPEDFGEAPAAGEARMFFSFPQPGRYIVGTDLVAETGPYAEQFVVEVAGKAAEPLAGAAAAPEVVVVEAEEGDRYTAPVLLDGADRAGGYQVTLARPGRIAAGEPATFTFRVTRGGAPVTDLRPYLDAALHLAVVKQDFGAFLHEHGTAAGEAAQGGHGSHEHPGEAAPEAHGDGGHADDAHGYRGPASFGPEVTASFAFPEPGRYVLFGQAAHGDRLLVARFPVTVEQPAADR